MPNPIPSWAVVDTLISYLAKRQLNSIPTNIKQMSWRMGLGSVYLLKLLDESGVEYKLVRVGKKKNRQNTLIILRDIPEEIAAGLAISREKIWDSEPKIPPEVEENDSKEDEQLESERYFLST